MKRTLAGAVTVALVAVAAGYALAAHRQDRPDRPSLTRGGPLVGTEGVSLALPMNVAEPVSFGELWLHNPGKQAILLERAELVGADPGLVRLGVYAKPLTAFNPGLIDGFKPSLGRPVKDRSIGPRRDAEIVFGLTVSRPGDYVSRGVEVTYRVGDRTYRRRFSISFRLCAPSKKYTGSRRCRHP